LTTKQISQEEGQTQAPSGEQLKGFVEESAARLEVPGVAVGIHTSGEDLFAYHGVTSIENPLPVEEDTLFQSGSTGKTFTATAIMRLVEQGQIDLDAPVKTYVPELELKDSAVAEKVTVLHLLNHTAGWQGDLMDNTGDGDDALAKYVELMAGLDQVTPLGATVSYNNASLSLAGRVIEKVTGKVFQHAMKELIFEPLGQDHSFFSLSEIMTRRFVVGHSQKPDGSIKVSRPWALPRGAAPAGGITTNIGDLITWAKFHLNGGRTTAGEQLLSKKLVDRMQKPTADLGGSILGDHVGISWWLTDIGGLRQVAHGGNTIGQNCTFLMFPERDFALAALTNSAPNGGQLSDELVKWALSSFLGVSKPEPEAISVADEDLAVYTGSFETIAVVANISPKDGGLLIDITIKPEVLDQLRETSDDPIEKQPPIPIGLLAGDGDRYVVTEGPAKGMTGYFVRSSTGEVEGIHVGGRLATRTST
jgi:CubicO group peptidase (beta-lactamase class C family)